MNNLHEEIRVPVAFGRPDLRGWIVGEEQHETLGLLQIVEFPSGHTARLTESEIVRVSPEPEVRQS